MRTTSSKATPSRPRANIIPRLAFGLVLVCMPLWGQSRPNKLSVPTDPVVREHLAEAEEALAGGRFDRAFELWQKVLDDRPTRVVPWERGPRAEEASISIVAGDRYRGAASWVLDRLEGVGQEGLDQYFAFAEPKAARLLDEAVSARDEQLLRACVARYGRTRSGQLARLALADQYLSEGRFEEGRVAAQGLRAFLASLPDGKIPVRNVVARVALALWGSHDREALANLLRTLAPDLADARVEVNGVGEGLHEFITGLLDRVRPEAPDPAPESRSNFTWGLPIHRQTFVSGSRNPEAYSRGDQALGGFPVVPSTWRQIVYSSDGLALRAQHLRTGKPVWPPVPASVREAIGADHDELLHHVVADRDLVFAYLQGTPLLDQPWRGSQTSVPSHRLTAVDVRAGKVVWSHASPDPKDSEDFQFLQGLSVNQPPVVVGETLYVAGTTFHGIFRHWLCALARNTGRVRWKTYIGAGQTILGRGGNPRRACVPGYVTESEGVLYYGTSMGVFSAVDAVTGNILWQVAYPSAEHFNERQYSRRRYTPDEAHLWYPSRPAVDAHRVYFAANDSPLLLAADKLTGKLTQVIAGATAPEERERHFLGIHRGLLLMAGQGIVALDAKTLRVKWRLLGDSRFARHVFGRPAVIGNEIHLTTASEREPPEFWIMEVMTGKVLAKDPLPHTGWLGNVAPSRFAFVVGSYHSVAARTR